MLFKISCSTLYTWKMDSQNYELIGLLRAMQPPHKMQRHDGRCNGDIMDDMTSTMRGQRRMGSSFRLSQLISHAKRQAESNWNLPKACRAWCQYRREHPMLGFFKDVLELLFEDIDVDREFSNIFPRDERHRQSGSLQLSAPQRTLSL